MDVTRRDTKVVELCWKKEEKQGKQRHYAKESKEKECREMSCTVQDERERERKKGVAMGTVPCGVWEGWQTRR